MRKIAGRKRSQEMDGGHRRRNRKGLSEVSEKSPCKTCLVYENNDAMNAQMLKMPLVRRTNGVPSRQRCVVNG